MIKLLVENSDFTDFCCVIPSVSVGNVGQFSVDLLIASLKLTKIGYIYHRSILPVAGNNPYDFSENISVGCELYWNKDLKFIAIQIRSGFKKGKRDFVSSLCEWFKDNKIGQIIVLTGSHAHERIDKQLIGKPLRFIFCPLTNSKHSEEITNLGWLEYEKKALVLESNGVSTSIPGAGITNIIFDECLKKNIACAVLIEFCSDGNNIPDAIYLTDYLDSWLKLKKRLNITDNEWNFPPSWNLLFGAPQPTELS